MSNPTTTSDQLASVPRVYAAMIQVSRLISAVGKDRENKFHRYNFRGIDDVYNAIHPALASAGVFVLPTVEEQTETEYTTKKGEKGTRVILKMRFDFVAIDGSRVSCTTIGEGMDTGDKAVNKAMSAAQKYAFLQTFTIPTESGGMFDSENDSPSKKSTRQHTLPNSADTPPQRHTQKSSKAAKLPAPTIEPGTLPMDYFQWKKGTAFVDIPTAETFDWEGEKVTKGLMSLKKRAELNGASATTLAEIQDAIDTRAAARKEREEAEKLTDWQKVLKDLGWRKLPAHMQINRSMHTTEENQEAWRFYMEHAPTPMSLMEEEMDDLIEWVAVSDSRDFPEDLYKDIIGRKNGAQRLRKKRPLDDVEAEVVAMEGGE